MDGEAKTDALWCHIKKFKADERRSWLHLCIKQGTKSSSDYFSLEIQSAK